MSSEQDKFPQIENVEDLPVFDFDSLDDSFADFPPPEPLPSDTTAVVMVGSSYLYMEALGWMLEGLRETITVVAEATTLEEARIAVNDSLPSLVIIDMGDSSFDAITLVRMLRVDNPGQTFSIMILADDKRRGLLREAMEAGANAFILKSTNGRELASHIDKVLNGEIAVSPTLIDQLFESIQNPLQIEELTRRELQVLDLLEKNMTSAMIAMVLNISVRTVQKHLTNMYSKAGVDNREDMIAFARRRGFGE